MFFLQNCIPTYVLIQNLVPGPPQDVPTSVLKRKKTDDTPSWKDSIVLALGDSYAGFSLWYSLSQYMGASPFVLLHNYFTWAKFMPSLQDFRRVTQELSCFSGVAKPFEMSKSLTYGWAIFCIHLMLFSIFQILSFPKHLNY